MKNYETPEIMVVNLETTDVIAAQLTESGDNETGWVESWTSGISGNN